MLVVAHKGIIGTILSEMLGRATAQRTTLPIDLASIHTLRLANGGSWVADVANDVRHLDGLR